MFFPPNSTTVDIHMNIKSLCKYCCIMGILFFFFNFLFLSLIHFLTKKCSISLFMEYGKDKTIKFDKIQRFLIVVPIMVIIECFACSALPVIPMRHFKGLLKNKSFNLLSTLFMKRKIT